MNKRKEIYIYREVIWLMNIFKYVYLDGQSAKF